MDSLNIRFHEGWIMLRRGFDFAELNYHIPKLSLVYVYSDRPIFKKHVKEEYYEELEREAQKFESLPDWLQVTTDIGDEIIPDDMQYEEYEGEVVQTLFSGHLTRFFPGEYQVTTIQKYQELDDFHLAYNLRKNDEMYLKQKEIADRVHYLMSRGMSRKTAELYVSASAKHAVWFSPSEEVQEIFEGFEPCKFIM